MKILVINGPNLNLLGDREKENYGEVTLDSINSDLKVLAGELGVEVDFFQSNTEGEIVDKIQSAKGNFDGIIINPAAYTHTSIAILDALKSVNIPTIEVHITRISERESYRQISYIRDYVLKVYEGDGFNGYIKAIEYLINKINESLN